MTKLEIEIIGLIAAILTTFAFIPQVIRIWKKRTSGGVSITMYVIMFLGICTWFVYGTLIDSFAVMVANALSGVLQLLIIVFAVIFRKNT
ncbi:MAG: hypothetical protein EBS74_01550 [Flavobacteriia bacterium]|nr:hypothetical protein [Flavobacteriia bacterium]